MKTSFLPLIVAVVALASQTGASAEEANGLRVTVAKTTLDKADTRGGGYYYSDRIDRTQALKVTIKNTSFKERPEGEVEWAILVKKYYSTTVEIYSGKEKLKGLKPAEIEELVIGAAQILGWRDPSSQVKDKIEWQVIIKEGGKDVLKMASTSSFDSLAKRAIKVAAPPKKN